MKKLICVFAGIFCWPARLWRRRTTFILLRPPPDQPTGRVVRMLTLIRYFNSGGNWTSGDSHRGKIGPGSTVHVCGTITVAGQHRCADLSGKRQQQCSGHTVLRERRGFEVSGIPAAGLGRSHRHQQPELYRHQWKRRRRRSDPGSDRGDGDRRFRSSLPRRIVHATTTTATAIEADSSNNLTVEGLSIVDMYVTTTGVPSGGGGSCIWGHGQSTNWTITNNVMHDVSWCINLQYDSGTSSQHHHLEQRDLQHRPRNRDRRPACGQHAENVNSLRQ